jgi:transposase-like protein
MFLLSQPFFHDEQAAYAFLEAVIWPDGPICPHCGAVDRIYTLKGKSTRIGVRKCGHCRNPFRVTVGTVFESSHVPLHKWLQATFLMCASKKGISAHQLHRTLQVSYPTAWFMEHRIREAMRSGELAPMGGLGGIVEVDETFIGKDRTIKPRGEKKGRGYAHKHKVLALVDREAGTARTMVVDDLKASTLTPFLAENIAREARVMTDEAGYYARLKHEFADHEFVRHSAEEWARGEVHIASRSKEFWALPRSWCLRRGPHYEQGRGATRATPALRRDGPQAGLRRRPGGVQAGSGEAGQGAARSSPRAREEGPR